MRVYRLTEAAKDDYRQILRTSLETFGVSASVRYKKLIIQAFEDLTEEPERPESRLTEQGIRLYHLRHSAKQAPVDGIIVRKPRHMIAYRIGANSRLEIIRILYDAMHFERHLL